ncbi:iron-sulfur cluster assembly scaffold protein [Desulfoprunum benzoelyticum]|uniref:Nitrogen fixation NifU-like protein n=1 Tax=Desulfoprunum benzoelyticum TaxID=1506996 RepID=A0A840V1W7_9BACT|nr:iron-sulfur cluster assembly scaffold protein [Desulfoprunum benzoelyticum]MBB5347709.1 nitrogen fixation NifU-like protein [Desulfoprunum benzoelyticum]MBM9529302.1 iron-sulfur cluster assembly scaffold protein [Desulfoprunum benzoelyticum]
MEPELPAIDQAHSAQFIDMASRTNRLKIVPHPDGYGKRVSSCGDSIELYLSVRDDRIRAVSFLIQGCLNTNACANTLASLVEGKSVAEGWQLTPADIMEYLQTLPAEHTHCAELAVEALHQALKDYSATRREPWKKVYRKR